jgi:hypothetical protein
MGSRLGIAIVLGIALTVVLELITRHGGDFSYHRWRKFEWFILLLIVAWIVIRKKS